MNTETMIGTLIERGDFELLRGAHRAIHSASVYIEQVEDGSKYTLRYILDFSKKYRKYPTHDELVHYAETNSDRPDLIIKPDQSDSAVRALQGIRTHWPASQGYYVTEGRKGYARTSLQVAMTIATGGGIIGDPRKKEKDLVGPDDAWRYLAKCRTEDFGLPPSSPEGAWRDNADLSADALIDGKST
jgi:hypothetical protein